MNDTTCPRLGDTVELTGRLAYFAYGEATIICDDGTRLVVPMSIVRLPGEQSVFEHEGRSALVRHG